MQDFGMPSRLPMAPVASTSSYRSCSPVVDSSNMCIMNATGFTGRQASGTYPSHPPIMVDDASGVLRRCLYTTASTSSGNNTQHHRGSAAYNNDQMHSGSAGQLYPTAMFTNTTSGAVRPTNHSTALAAYHSRTYTPPHDVLVGGVQGGRASVSTPSEADTTSSTCTATDSDYADVYECGAATSATLHQRVLLHNRHAALRRHYRQQQQQHYNNSSSNNNHNRTSNGYIQHHRQQRHRHHRRLLPIEPTYINGQQRMMLGDADGYFAVVQPRMRSLSHSRVFDVNIPGSDYYKTHVDQPINLDLDEPARLSPPTAGYHRRLPPTPASVIVGNEYSSQPHINVQSSADDLRYGASLPQPPNIRHGSGRRLPATPFASLAPGPQPQRYASHGNIWAAAAMQDQPGTMSARGSMHSYMDAATKLFTSRSGSQSNLYGIDTNGAVHQQQQPTAAAYTNGSITNMSTTATHHYARLPPEPQQQPMAPAAAAPHSYRRSPTPESHKQQPTHVTPTITEPHRYKQHHSPRTRSPQHHAQPHPHHPPKSSALSNAAKKSHPNLVASSAEAAQQRLNAKGANIPRHASDYSIAGGSSVNESQLSSPSLDRIASPPNAAVTQEDKKKGASLSAVVENGDDDIELFNLDDFLKPGMMDGLGDEAGDDARSSSPIPPAEPNKVHSVSGVQCCGCGSLHFTVQFFSVRKRIRVNVIKAEDIGGHVQGAKKELQCFAKVRLMPGKDQEQSSSTQTYAKTLAINEEFFFDNITPELIDQRTLQLQMCYTAEKGDEPMGTVSVPLSKIPNITSKMEVKLREEMRPKMSKKLGKLSFTTQLEKSAKRLSVNVTRADDLPKFAGKSPDPLVRITLEQGGKTQTKQTRALKHCCSGVWKETVMFLVNTKDADLKATAITIAVHDKARTANGFDLIGCCYLGTLAKDKTELDHWKSTVGSSREQKGQHVLKFPGVTEDDED